MAKTQKISVRFDAKNNAHKCNPTEVKVSPGDTLVWISPDPLLVFFEKKSPVVEGRGPFENDQATTIKAKPPLKKGERFQATTALKGRLRETRGDIIVT